MDWIEDNGEDGIVSLFWLIYSFSFVHIHFFSFVGGGVYFLLLASLFGLLACSAHFIYIPARLKRHCIIMNNLTYPPPSHSPTTPPYSFKLMTVHTNQSKLRPAPPQLPFSSLSGYKSQLLSFSSHPREKWRPCTAVLLFRASLHCPIPVYSPAQLERKLLAFFKKWTLL